MRRVSVTSLRGNSSPPSPSDPPRCDRPTRQISDFSPNSPDHALRFTAIRASERFRGRVALPAPSGPLPRCAFTNASARNARHGAPRGPIRARRQSTKRPASTSRRALNSPSWTRTSNLAVNSRPLYRLSYRGMLGREGDPSESPLASQASGISGGFLRQIPTKMRVDRRCPRVRGWGGGAPALPGGAAAQTHDTAEYKHFSLGY